MEKVLMPAIKPSVFHLATTKLVDTGVADYLEHVGAPDWSTDTDDDSAELIEIAGRSCYRSFGAGLNKNVTRVREGNENYVGNSILAQKHGSVLEHAYDTFAICDVSRIVTHELVRHRQGTAFSQESGRFIRVDKINYYVPEAFDDDFLRSIYDELQSAGHIDPYDGDFDWWAADIRNEFADGMRSIESTVGQMESKLQLDNIKDFGKKKKLQSAIRRLSPNGATNNIIMTGNHRAWRYIVSARTSGAAEEEIRLAQYALFEILEQAHPNIYQDAIVDYDQDVLPKNIPVVTFRNEKV